jgi:hypothetical protein
VRLRASASCGVITRPPSQVGSPGVVAGSKPDAHTVAATHGGRRRNARSEGPAARQATARAVCGAERAARLADRLAGWLAATVVLSAGRAVLAAKQADLDPIGATHIFWQPASGVIRDAPLS